MLRTYEIVPKYCAILLRWVGLTWCREVLWRFDVFPQSGLSSQIILVVTLHPS